MISPDVKIYTDGSCSPNPGPGGWGAVMLFQKSGKVIELSGAVENATNNRMEVTAALYGLKALENRCEVEIFTDSRYLQRGVTEWLAGWQKNGWSTMDGGEVKNRDLWVMLSETLARHTVRWHWVKGHSNDRWNARADELAAEARLKNAISYGAKSGGVMLYPGVTWKNSTGEGSWAVILHYRDHYKVLGGARSHTTANKLYLVAVIEGLKAIKRPLPVTVNTKSGYLRDGLGTWIDGWCRRGWQTREGAEVSNKNEWQQLQKLRQKIPVEVVMTLSDDLPCLMLEAKEIAREFEQS